MVYQIWKHILRIVITVLLIRHFTISISQRMVKLQLVLPLNLSDYRINPIGVTAYGTFLNK